MATTLRSLSFWSAMSGVARHQKRYVLLFVLLCTLAALGMEVSVTDEKRTELSATVFTGTVTNVQHSPLWKTNKPPMSAPGALGFNPLSNDIQDLGLWRAEVVVQSVTKQDEPLGNMVVVYYPQRPMRPTFAVRVCPGYPTIETNMHATFWCQRVTIEGFTNILYASMPSWVKRH